MEGAGIWILVILFYLLQAITKNQQRKKRIQEQQDEQPVVNESIEDLLSRSTSKRSKPAENSEIPESAPEKPEEAVSFEDIFNPEKLRDMFGVPQPKPTPKAEKRIVNKSIVRPKVKHEMRNKWEEPIQEKPSLQRKEVKETGSKVASADITDVDETAAQFKSTRLAKSDVTSDRFDKRKEAPGEQKPSIGLEYFDEPEDIRHAVILKEILDRPRAFRKNIR